MNHNEGSKNTQVGFIAIAMPEGVPSHAGRRAVIIARSRQIANTTNI